MNAEIARAVGLLDYGLQILDALVVHHPEVIDPAEIAAIDMTRTVIIRVINNYLSPQEFPDRGEDLE